MSGSKAVPTPVPKAVVVIACGTFVAQWYAELVYGSLAEFLRERGYEVRTLAIPKLGLGSMDEALEEMALSLLAEYADPDIRFIIIGHSQGGSHAVGLMKQLKGRVIRPVISLSAPHHGTRLANLGTPLHFLPKSFQDMAAHSGVLRRLRTAEDALEELAETEVVSLMSLLDSLVWPFWASVLNGAENILLAPAWLHPLLRRAGFRRSNGVELVDGYTGHLGIIKHPAVLDAIGRQFDKLEQAYAANQLGKGSNS